ncbi:MAG: lytic murein transglycosylase [Candidatus Liptonbacteria bacterium]|nr:lytic murein transglycosylase [Candidatus Liptonbacteria bacterium]
MKLLKPKVLEDIQLPSKSVFRKLEWRVNLSYHPENKIRVSFILKYSAIVGALVFLFMGSASAPISNQTLAQTVSQPPAEQERQALEVQLKELEAQMDTYQTQIKGYQKQGNSLKGEINQLNSKISQVSVQIKAINLTLSQIDKNINETTNQISVTENTISSNKDTLSVLLRQLYVSEQANLLEIFLKHPKLSDFFNDVNSMDNLQNNLRLAIVRITELREQLGEQKSQLALARADAASVREYQVAKKNESEEIKNHKNNLLAVTKGQESKYQALLKQTKETAAQIRSRIFQLLGGGQLSFEEAYSYAKLAGDATGVRPAMILAVLDRESALGQNVGRCTYNQVSAQSGRTAMHPTRDIPIFLEITKALNIDPGSITVSCANRDGAYGGAMGPAQFIPSTWKIYTGKISSITGRSPANPWNNADAFVATALYLRDAGAAGDPSISQERIAAARYYAGGNWSRYLWTYGQAVVNLAEKFQQDIDTITG